MACTVNALASAVANCIARLRLSCFIGRICILSRSPLSRLFLSPLEFPHLALCIDQVLEQRRRHHTSWHRRVRDWPCSLVHGDVAPRSAVSVDGRNRCLSVSVKMYAGAVSLLSPQAKPENSSINVLLYLGFVVPLRCLVCVRTARGRRLR